ncbi:transcription elongation factor Spt5 [Polyplosphaeria fusca]|uniref:Transcription elongation factor SPT5 n=1 Tax=Polyplosphaeria fusca TaxID=682080 RepID=A0A9P4QWV1_9PLEO|nr:transcription elongation factor Spt5 [Polyplosphaeria fusca]
MASYDNRSGSESEDDDFNPEPMVDEDDIPTNGHQKRKPTLVDEDEEEQAEAPSDRRADNDDEDDEEGGEDGEGDEEEDDEEDDEDEIQRPHKRRKNKQSRRNQYIDLEAEVDEDEDEEEELGDEDMPEETHPEDLEVVNETDDRRHRELDMKRQVEQHKDAEQLAKEYDEKYRRREMQRAQRGVAGGVPTTLPTVNDPSIWAIKCRPGKEREVVMSITKRLDEYITTGRAAKVYSVFERGGSMSGYIYVEADAKQDMLAAVEGISNVFMGSGQVAIDVKERPDLLRKRRRTPLEEGKFVRVLRPTLYKGDLAKVIEVHTNGLDCTLQIVPRLDYGMGEDANAADGGKRKRPMFGKVVDRPPQKLFNESEAKKKHMKNLSMTGSGSAKAFVYKGDDYHNGFLLKDVKVNHVSAENVNPKMEEIQFFSAPSADGSETVDLLAVQAAQKASQSGSQFVAGDNVEIYDGEQKGVRGTTVSVLGDIVTLRVIEGDLKGRQIDAPVKTLRKLFREGDHVKVIGGSKYVDEVGMVLNIKGAEVKVLSDATQTEFTVFSRDLKLAADSATLGPESQFELFDMVQIDAATVGIVVKVDREVLRVLTQNGDERQVIHSQVSSVLGRNRNAVATDRDGSEVRVDDKIKEHGGETRQGRVMYIHRGVLFIQSQEVSQNAGVFVVRGTNVNTLSTKSGRDKAQGPDLGQMNPAMQAGPGGGIGSGGTMAPPRTFGRDKMIGKTVTIKKGPYKGLLGIVKDTMGDEARIELHSKNKQISVKRELLGVKDPITGNSVDFGNKFPNRNRGGGGGYPGSNAQAGGRTPGWGNKSGPSWATPSGGRTPGWGGGRTPGWGGADGGRTAYGGDGSRTAYGGDGSRTAYGGATAYGGNDGSRTAYGGFNSGGRTPGGPSWGNAPSKSSNNLSAPTPGASYNAPTPAPYSAPTPGGYGAYSAPTPGGGPVDAPTPGGGYDAPTPAGGPTPKPYGYGGTYGATPAAAPTPGAWAETPWGGGPETPAPSGYDEDPRYD